MSQTPKLGTSKDQPRPFKSVLPREKLQEGETYLGWFCKTCGQLIAVDESAPDSARIPDAHFVEVTCPHCHTKDVRSWAGRTDLQYSCS